MRYLYYPGCSLKGTGRAYEESLLASLAALDLPLIELDDWNCCGATAYMCISELKAIAISARNLALAQAQGPGPLVVPCAACYLGLRKTKRYLEEHESVRETVDGALRAAGLQLSADVGIRHPLDILVHDLGLEKVTARVTNPLKGLKVACYYGCQLIRPFADFDDQHDPTTMDRIVEALGGEPIQWPLKARCCGGSLSGTVQEVGLRLSYIVLREARRRGADVVATACPLCQFNLECHQRRMRRRFENGADLPVAYFTQLMGVAFGLPPREIGLERLFIPLPPIEAETVAGGSHAAG